MGGGVITIFMVWGRGCHLDCPWLGPGQGFHLQRLRVISFQTGPGVRFPQCTDPSEGDPLGASRPPSLPPCLPLWEVGLRSDSTLPLPGWAAGQQAPWGPRHDLTTPE